MPLHSLKFEELNQNQFTTVLNDFLESVFCDNMDSLDQYVKAVAIDGVSEDSAWDYVSQSFKDHYESNKTKYRFNYGARD